MRIAINTRFLLKDRLEGMGRYIWEVAQRMARDHPEDTFLFLFDRPFDVSFTGLPNIRGTIVQPPARHPFLFIAWYEFAIPRILRQERVDVFWSPDNFCSLRAPCPTLLTIHDLAYRYYPEYVSWAQLQYYQYFTPRFVQAAAHIHTVSKYVMQDVQRCFPEIASKVSVAYNGCREVFRPLSSDEISAVRMEYSDGAPYFLYVGAIHPRKNVHRLVAAFDMFKSETGLPHKLLLCGRMAWQTDLVQKALDQATFRHDIILLGFVPDAALPRLTAAAFALTYVSLFEGFGVPLLEGLHCEIPVLTSNTTSMPEVVGDAAILVDPNEVTEIATGMIKLATDAEYCLQLIQKGRVQRRHFEWDHTAQTVYKQLKMLAGIGLSVKK